MEVDVAINLNTLQQTLVVMKINRKRGKDNDEKTTFVI